jgi:hypothetical protein
VPSRRAVEKAGFVDIALMRTMRTAAWRRVRVDAGANAVAGHLARHLAS